MDDTHVVTQEGYDKLEIEHKELKDQKRPGAVEKLKRAREMGDLSENNAYHTARDELAFIDQRISDLEVLLKKAQVVTKSADKAVVQVGNTVDVRIDGKDETFTVVGDLEGDISQNRLSSKSPIGKALLGKKKGDFVDVKIPAGTATYQILDIR